MVIHRCNNKKDGPFINNNKNMITLLSYLLSFLFFILFINFTLFYLDDFKLSQNKYIITLQILTPI